MEIIINDLSVTAPASLAFLRICLNAVVDVAKWWYVILQARKTLSSLRRTKKLRAFTYHNSVKKQTTNTSIHVHAWSKIQAEIRARRANMVAEGRIRQKKHDNQLKLEAKLHDLEVRELHVQTSQPWETRPSTLTKVANRVGMGARLPSSVKHASIDGKEFAKKPSKQSDEETANKESNTEAANSGHSRTKTT
ncbi:hypothetical protein BHM03_00062857 [Ensete ventricosum]|nr:hypothetical protein BHM03_00062857 [Ensete ventricosum]